MANAHLHLHEELASNAARVTVETKFGKITGGRASNGAVVFLGFSFTSRSFVPGAHFKPEVPYALPPLRFADPVALPTDYRYKEGKEYITEASCTFNQMYEPVGHD